MANPKAKSSSQPIVRHPLFPTIVAFWFAALFGLGSLAVRTSLLESLVIASKIDLIVPQTAPPLGITARILIALAMAAIGSIVGFILAARLARPKPEVRGERVRNFGAAGRAAAPARAAPAQAWEEDDRFSEPDRRRSLIASNEGPAEIFDDGPSFLTGLSPQVLDVTEFECDPIDRPPAEPAQPEQGAPALELDAFATIDPVPAPGFEIVNAPQAAAEPIPVAQVQPETPEIDYAGPAPFGAFAQEPAGSQESPRAFDAPEARRPAFAPPESQPESVPAGFGEPHHETPAAEFAPGSQTEPMRQIFGAPVTSPLQDTIAIPPVAAAPEQLQPLDTASPAETASNQEIPAVAAETDDSDPMATFHNRQAPLPEFRDEPDVLYAPEPPVTGLHNDPWAGFEPAAGYETPEPQPVAAPVAAPLSPAAERLMKAELSDLSQLELIERLALSLQRRGQVATAAPFLAAYQPEPEVHVPFEQEPAAPVAEMPAAEAPGAEASASRLALPAAMRPIDFSQYEHDEDMPEYVPARSIAMPSFKSSEPSELVEPPFRPFSEVAELPAAPAMPRFGRQAEMEEPSAQNEEEVLEAGYSSLLDMTRPAGQRQQFVRFIDPAAETEAAEPVVIFPGQAMRAGTRFSAPSEGPLVAPSAPLPSLGDAPGQSRRFDAPPAPTQFAPASAPVRNSEETERALRSALSTLQRMSGAA